MAAKITFPNRPCPKCGKPIHIKSKSHEACGWTAEVSTASPKETPAKTEAPNGKPMSKMEAVRRILKDSGKETMPVDIQAQLKKNFGIKMNTATISTYKGTILRHGARKKMGRPKAETMVAHSPTKANGATGISLEDIMVVKELAKKLGADRLGQLAELVVQ